MKSLREVTVSLLLMLPISALAAETCFGSAFGKGPEQEFNAKMADLTWMQGTTWALTVQYGEESRAPLVKEQVLESAQSRAPQYKAIAERLTRTLMNDKTMLIGDYEVVFMPPTTPGCTFVPVKYKAKKAIYLQDLGATVVFNTLKSDERKRSNKVFANIVVPVVEMMFEGSPTPDYYIVAVTYGTKDFSDDSPLSTKGETLVGIVPRTAISAYVKGEQTIEDLARSSTGFLAGRGKLSARLFSLGAPGGE